MLPKGLLKEHSRAIAVMLRFMDMITVFAAGLCAYYYRFNEPTILPSYQGAIFIGMFLTPVIFSFFDIYNSMRGKGFLVHIAKLIQAVAVLVLLMAGMAFFTKSGNTFSRAWFSVWMSFSLVALIFFRCTTLGFLRYMRAYGLNERRIVIIGAGGLGTKLAETIQQKLWTGFRVICFMDDDAKRKPAFIRNIPVLQTPASISEYLSKEDIDEFWIALPLQAEPRVKVILHELRHQTITTRFVLDIYGLDLFNHSITDLAGFPMLNVCSTPMLGINRIVKAIEDRLLAALILVAISPLFLLIAMVVKLSSRGPIFYKQKRIGWSGREFEMLKFRTMPVNAEEKTGPVWSTQNDTRATWLGKFLRRASLDELPQFINVLKGDMSIVGPRPERKIFVDEFKTKVPGYMQKHLVKAGITGWAQVNGWRGNTSLEKRIEFDLYYIENWSLSFDIKIILLTFFRGFVNHNAY